MKLCRLHLIAFGPFTQRTLDFGTSANRLSIVFGPNEAGKSSALRAISDLRFGIPQQSADNFMHEHRQMLIGGEFLDHEGRQHSLLRRKGRNDTLSLAGFPGGPPIAGNAAPAAIQALLDCGLSRDAYETMFGLDHRRLREGGEALLRGEGDVGAALFEASAGTRSVPQVLDALETAARELFMPGPRGKSGRINKALADFNTHQKSMRQASTRPQVWNELFKTHRARVEGLEKLESQRHDGEAARRLVLELRGVAPLLATLDAASGVLASLHDAPLLADNAVVEHTRESTSLAGAELGADAARAAIEREQRVLGELPPTDPIITFAAAVRRLAAAADDIDRQRRERAVAAAAIEHWRDQTTRLAHAIDPMRDATDLLRLAPSKTQAAAIRQGLKELEFARRSLLEHRDAVRRAEAPDEDEAQVLPQAAAMAALRQSLHTLTANQRDLERLAATPAQRSNAERAVASVLATLGLADEAALHAARPLLAARIDAAIKDEHGGQAQAQALRERVEKIDTALGAAQHELAAQRATGAIATRSEVDMARAARDAQWQGIKGIAASARASAAYEAAVERADTLVDTLARDTERAAQVQAIEQQIAILERDREALSRELTRNSDDARDRQSAWANLVEASRLPRLAPAALREWQSLLPEARTAFDRLHATLDDHERLKTLEQEIASQLRDALVNLGTAPGPLATDVRVLAALAHEAERELREREARIQQTSGKALARQQRLKRDTVRESELSKVLDTAIRALLPAFDALLLADQRALVETDANADTTVAVVQARLEEFDELREAHGCLDEARDGERRARQALALFAQDLDAVHAGIDAGNRAAGTPGESGEAQRFGGGELRQQIDHLVKRLDEAQALHQKRERAREALDAARADLRDREAALELHRQALVALCAAAGVSTAAQLPEAQTRSQRKRRAQEEIDATRLQLAKAAPRRTIDQLRALLSTRDSAVLDQEEHEADMRIKRIGGEIETARAAEEAARSALDAIDGSDTAAAERDAMERAGATVRSAMPLWLRTRLAHALLDDALGRFRERAQGPMLKAASSYFSRMTRGEFTGLRYDDGDGDPVLVALRREVGEADGQGRRAPLTVGQMSEGTRDQLYLALRLAALDLRRASGIDLPVILDDILMTSDDERSGAMLETLAEFARGNQVIVFTHHRHIATLAERVLPAERLQMLAL